MGLRLASFEPPPPTELVEMEPGRGSARFRLRRPDARSVALLGSFSLWEPLPMERTKDGWTLRVDLPPGTHHFGFLVDGEWFVPEGAAGRVDDEWGRTNATVVVP